MRMHQNVSQQTITQMPQITRPDPLHLTTIRQLTKDGVDEVTNPSQDRTLVGRSLWANVLCERALARQSLLFARTLADQEANSCDHPTPRQLCLPARWGTISPSDSLAGARYKRVSRPGQLNCACNRKP